MIDYSIGACEDLLPSIESNSVDCIVTDPPYGLKFMGLNWDKTLPSETALKECCRVLKPGAFGFFMCAPRQDLLSRMVIRLEDAGFKTGFTSIYWTFASGFPKAMDISKVVDKRNGRTLEEYKELGEYLKLKRIEGGKSQKDIASLFPSRSGGLTGCVWNWENSANVPTIEQFNLLKSALSLDNRFDELIEREEAEREVMGRKEKLNAFVDGGGYKSGSGEYSKNEICITAPETDNAKSLNGSYAGFQPKPATEIIIVVMKPLSEKTYVDQALKNGKGVTWLGNCKIPYSSDMDKESARFGSQMDIKGGNLKNPNGVLAKNVLSSETGRFPANILCSDDVLNDGVIHKTQIHKSKYKTDMDNPNLFGMNKCPNNNSPANEGSFSRYFSLDSWFDKKIKELPESIQKTFPYLIVPKPSKNETTLNGTIENKHPTKKPLKLMCYLITLGSRPGDLILDPYAGTGVVGRASNLLERDARLCELNPEYEPVIKEMCK